MRRLLPLVFLLSACGSGLDAPARAPTGERPGPADEAEREPTLVEPAIGAVLELPAPAPDLVFTDFPPLHATGPTTLGSALQDLVDHTPQGQVSIYFDSDMTTWAHETSHAIHAHLRNNVAPDYDTNGFYVLDDLAVLIAEPPIRKSEVAPFVPAGLREFRFGTYVTGQSAWDDTPLYLWDEWNAYVNGAEASARAFDEGEWPGGWRDQSGNIEFVGYALATGLAVETLAPAYLEEEPQFLGFLAFNVARALALHARFSGMDTFQSDTQDALYDALMNGSDAAALRDFAQRHGVDL